MLEEIPAEYLEGIAGVDVSPRTVPHPDRAGVYTMGECIPIDAGASGDQAPSHVVLYFGSFRALASDRPDFDWRAEAWETLTHELRHHLEWRAHEQGLEEYDRAAEEGFARADAEPFDPLFYLGGEKVATGTYQVDDDVFFDRVVRERPRVVEFEWRGRRFRAPVPDGPLPLYVVLDGLTEPPPGDAILVLRRKPSLLDFFRRARRVTERAVEVEPLG
ncbi:MAG: hypothetical protein EXR93_02610 [Gemmatimonadetes bacterium]|nr:hypothetical protein [Gemmatimonadota bacterium]